MRAFTLLVALLLTACAANRAPVPHDAAAHAVIGVESRQLDPAFWIRRQPDAQRTILDARAIDSQNARLERLDPSVHDFEALPEELSADQVRGWILQLSGRPDRPLFDEQGAAIGDAQLEALEGSLALDAIPAKQASRYGLIVRRADLRTFPTRMRVFDSSDDTDIDRFQETALFPGAAVLIAHESRDGAWYFVVSSVYAAWIEKSFVAMGPRQQVLDYTHRTPYLVVTGSTARTVHTREQPAVSELQLDMGVRVPVLDDWPANRPVNGQHPYTGHVIELPVRADDGSLAFRPALLPMTADVTQGYLALNRANLLRQSFKFLGERYGWGHSYNARDCSGFVSDVYRSFGVKLPRNTRDQGVSPALNRVAFTSADSHEARLAALRGLQVGDLIYIPGHVMMVIGRIDGAPYVIHDTVGISYRNGDGGVTRVSLNEVSVTPVVPLLFRDGSPLVDGITNILRIRP
jgi:cell wall-associated NlpC family hydrolase